jgi:hypothetical protein
MTPASLVSLLVHRAHTVRHLAVKYIDFLKNLIEQKLNEKK